MLFLILLLFLFGFFGGSFANRTWGEPQSGPWQGPGISVFTVVVIICIVLFLYGGPHFHNWPY